jgi:hypothetical protein
MAEASASQASDARAYIRALLKGSPPNRTPLAAWREHRDVIDVLEQAHNTGGTPAVRSAMVGIVRRHPELIPLIAGNGGDGTATVWVPPEGWPVLDQEALYGVAGELTVAITPYTEADPVAVLLNILTAFGNVVGSEPHFRVEFTKHHLRLFVVLVGASAKGRKGQSWSTPRYVFSRIDADWARDRVSSGLSSGEGLIYHVRDPRVEKQPIKEKGRVVDYAEVIVDHGVSDKRLLIVEEEFAQALKVMSREGNILSPVLRQAWDTGDLHPLTKTNPIRASEAHISIIGHITRDELLRHLNDTEQANGFANRFLWACVRRSNVIPEPVGIPQEIIEPLITRLTKTVKAAQQIHEIHRDDEAKACWAEDYAALSAEKPGLLGAMTARAEAQVMRLACLYAALDKTCLVSPAHLKAARALWQYCEASVRYIFGARTGDPVADRILLALDEQGELALSAISGLFDRHMEQARLEQALQLLKRARLIKEERVKTKGRPMTVIRRTQT